MNINDLTQDEALELLNTDFGTDMEKEASAIVEAEEYVEYGIEMAKEAASNLEANYEAEESEEDSYDTEKVAQANYTAELIQEGFVSELMKLGEANYGDPMIYLEEMAKEAGVVNTVMNKLKRINPFSGTAMGHMKAKGIKKQIAANAKKGGKALNEIGNLKVLKAALKKGKKTAVRNRYIGGAVGGTGALGGAYALGNRD